MKMHMSFFMPMLEPISTDLIYKAQMYSYSYLQTNLAEFHNTLHQHLQNVHSYVYLLHFLGNSECEFHTHYIVPDLTRFDLIHLSQSYQ